MVTNSSMSSVFHTLLLRLVLKRKVSVYLINLGYIIFTLSFYSNFILKYFGKIADQSESDSGFVLSKTPKITKKFEKLKKCCL